MKRKLPQKYALAAAKLGQLAKRVLPTVMTAALVATAAIPLELQAAGFFKFVAHKVDENGEIISSRVAADWFPNLITNNGMEYIGNYATSTQRRATGIAVGTGNTPPAFTDVNLATWKAATTTVQVAAANTAQATTIPYYISQTQTMRFAAGVAAGNLTEVGVVGATNSPTSSTAPLFSRALIVDGGGTPIVLPILSDEVLDVTYEFRTYMPNGGADVTGTFNMTIDGVSTAFGYTIRPVNMLSVSINTGGFVGDWGFTIWGTNTQILAFSDGFGFGPTTLTALVAVTANPTGGSNSDFSSVSTAAYTAGTYRTDLTYNLALNTFNQPFKMMKIRISPGMCFQMLMDTNVNKIATKTFTFTIRLSWARYP